MTTPTSDVRLDPERDLALCDSIYPWEWTLRHEPGEIPVWSLNGPRVLCRWWPTIDGEGTPKDAAFISSARALLPAYIDAYERLTSERDAALASILGAATAVCGADVVAEFAPAEYLDAIKWAIGELQRERDAAVERSTKLHRRCQRAEAATMVTVDQCREQGVSLSRGLLYVALDRSAAHVEELEDEVQRLREAIDANAKLRYQSQELANVLAALASKPKEDAT